MPDFRLEFPEALTKKVYIQLTAKLFAGIRYQVYCAIRQLVRTQPDPRKYITKNQMKDILQSLDTAEIRRNCFELFALPADTTERDLIKAYYTYMSDAALVKEVSQLKQSHERYMVGIMTCDVFPGLDK